MLPEAYYLLFLLPPVILLTYFDFKNKAKIHLIWLAFMTLYYLVLGVFFGYIPYTPIWFAGFVGIGSLVFLRDLGWADRIFIAASVIAVPSIYLLIVIGFAVIIYYMDKHANKLSPKLSIIVPDSNPNKKPHYIFMPYLAIGYMIVSLLAPMYGYLYWSQINSISAKYNFTHGYTNYTLLECLQPYNINQLPFNQSFNSRIVANTVTINTSNPAIGKCYYGLKADVLASKNKPT